MSKVINIKLKFIWMLRWMIILNCPKLFCQQEASFSQYMFNQQLKKYEAMKLIKRMSFSSELSTISTSNTSYNLVLELREKLKKQILSKIQ